MANKRITRRGILRGIGVGACSLAAHPLMTEMALASAPGDRRLVVLILRGGMDGLDVVQPVGDADFSRLRPGLRSPAHDLDGFFALNAGLERLLPLWKAQELAFVHAVSTPYRDKRSHFDGQDLLEAGLAKVNGMASMRSGWLNRLLQDMPGAGGETAFAIGRENLKILSGPAAVSNWAPSTKLDLSDQAQSLLSEIYHGDPLFRDSASEAMELAQIIAGDAETVDAQGQEMMAMMRQGGGQGEKALAAFAADRLNHETRIASFSINGWDTHRGQKNALTRPLSRLADVILTLKQGLSGNWAKTTVLAMTEFGRTVRENGTGGTDHGTGGVMVLAGGAIRGGRVYGNWPGLSEAALYDRRDLMPTGDVRTIAAWALANSFGASRNQLETNVFPGLDMADDPGLFG